MAAASSLFAIVDEFRPEEFHVVHRRDLGLTAFIAIDDTRLGPATGGIRWRAYPAPEDGARDVLVGLLVGAGAGVGFGEIEEERAARCADALRVGGVPVDAIFDAEVDVRAPCAVGEVITADAARRLRARGIAGAANNQLASDDAGRILMERSIWYAPDFAANAGAVIVGFETFAGRGEQALVAVRRI